MCTIIEAYYHCIMLHTYHCPSKIYNFSTATDMSYVILYNLLEPSQARVGGGCKKGKFIYYPCYLISDTLIVILMISLAYKHAPGQLDKYLSDLK